MHNFLFSAAHLLPTFVTTGCLQLCSKLNDFLKFLLCFSTDLFLCGFVSSGVPSDWLHMCIYAFIYCIYAPSSASSWGKMMLFWVPPKWWCNGSHSAPCSLCSNFTSSHFYVSHSGVIADGVLPALGILAWICFLNLLQCPGPLATPGSSSSVPVLTGSHPAGANPQALLAMVKPCQQHWHTSISSHLCTCSSLSVLFLFCKWQASVL